MSNKEHRVYVYGSLRKGGMFSNALSTSAFLGKKELEGFVLYDLGLYPAVKFSDNLKKKVVVEEYSINDKTLHRLDQIEGHPSFYKRTRLVDNAFIYVLNGDPSKHDPIIENGDWLKYIKENK